MGHCTCSLLRGSHAVADPSIFGYSIGMKLIALIIGLAAGFGVGVYWGVHHPSQAASLSAAEEAKFIEVQIKTSEAVKQKLDQLASKQQATPGNKFAGSGFVSSGSTTSMPDPEINSLRDQQDLMLQQLHQRLDQLKK